MEWDRLVPKLMGTMVPKRPARPRRKWGPWAPNRMHTNGMQAPTSMGTIGPKPAVMETNGFQTPARPSTASIEAVSQTSQPARRRNGTERSQTPARPRQPMVATRARCCRRIPGTQPHRAKGIFLPQNPKRVSVAGDRIACGTAKKCHSQITYPKNLRSFGHNLDTSRNT